MEILSWGGSTGRVAAVSESPGFDAVVLPNGYAVQMCPGHGLPSQHDGATVSAWRPACSPSYSLNPALSSVRSASKDLVVGRRSSWPSWRSSLSLRSGEGASQPSRPVAGWRFEKGNLVEMGCVYSIGRGEEYGPAWVGEGFQQRGALLPWRWPPPNENAAGQRSPVAAAVNCWPASTGSVGTCSRGAPPEEA